LVVDFLINNLHNLRKSAVKKLAWMERT
jgi:hypothetical protein